MGIESQIECLEQLAALDAEVKERSEQLDKERDDIGTVRGTIAQLDETLQRDRTSLAEMDKTRGELHQDLRNIGQQLDRSRERLQRSRNEREVQAAEREIDELRKLQRDRDEELTKLLAVCDQARATIEANDQKRTEYAERLSNSEQGALSRIAQLEKQVADSRAGRAAITARLPSLIARRYESMHARGKVPIAKTADGTCLGCYVQLPPMLFHSLLSLTQFGECANCHRILWYEQGASLGGRGPNPAPTFADPREPIDPEASDPPSSP